MQGGQTEQTNAPAREEIWKYLVNWSKDDLPQYTGSVIVEAPNPATACLRARTRANQMTDRVAINVNHITDVTRLDQIGYGSPRWGELEQADRGEITFRNVVAQVGSPTPFVWGRTGRGYGRAYGVDQGNDRTEEDPGLHKAEGQDEWGFAPDPYPGYAESGYRTKEAWAHLQDERRAEHRLRIEAQREHERRRAEEQEQREKEEAAQREEDEKRAVFRRSYLTERLGKARIKREEVALDLERHRATWPLGPDPFVNLFSRTIGGGESREDQFMRTEEELKAKLEIVTEQVEAILDLLA